MFSFVLIIALRYCTLKSTYITYIVYNTHHSLYTNHMLHCYLSANINCHCHLTELINNTVKKATILWTCETSMIGVTVTSISTRRGLVKCYSPPRSCSMYGSGGTPLLPVQPSTIFTGLNRTPPPQFTSSPPLYIPL